MQLVDYAVSFTAPMLLPYKPIISHLQDI